MFEIRSIIGETIGFIDNAEEFDNALAYYGEDRDGWLLTLV